MRDVLFVCPTFPPNVGGALARNLQFVRYLPEHGWRPTVLTVAARGGPWRDPTPLGALPEGVEVVRAWSVPYPSAAPGEREPSPAPRRASLVARLRRAARDLALEWVLIPDREIAWVPFAVRAALGLLRRRSFEAVLSAGPPHSAHVVARIVRGDHRWVADCPDPWAENPFLRHSAPRRRVEAWLESTVLGSADVVVTPSPALTDRFRARLAGRRPAFATIPNGYDETEFATARAERCEGLHIVHVGSFYGARSPAPFLSALVAVLESDPSLRRVLRVSFYGYAEQEARDAIRSMQARLGEDVLRYEPFIARGRALGVMLGADILLLVTDATAAGRELVPLKTFEYLRAGRPILALAPDGVLRDTLKRTGGAIVARPDAVDEIAAALRHLLGNGRPPLAPDLRIVAEYEARRLTGRLAQLLDASGRLDRGARSAGS